MIDRGAIARNYRRLAERAGGAAVIPVVKADAYGHGAVPVAQRLAAEGARFFAVAVAQEGIALRRAGIAGEILLLNFSDPGDLPLHRAYDLTPALYDLEQAKAFAEAAVSLPAPLPVQIKLDTGMGRLGFPLEEIPALARLVSQARGLSICGVFSHLSSAENRASAATAAQAGAFREAIRALAAAGLSAGFAHLANSAAILAHPDALFDAVRPGLALYGVLPWDAGSEGDEGLEPAMTLETRVIAVKRVAAGAPLGYGGAFVTRRPSTIAVLPIGYDDGLRRSFSGRVSLLLRGEHAPIVGAVSMDLTLVDATGCGAAPGDRVVCLGRDGARRVTAWDLARAAGTIPYEILCGIGARVARSYAP